ncbi:DUF4190 domain-containing protein [Saccharopolyspora spinosa]|uniref:DUF4190 domain-containing protein n=1 Tax=Saccharopolyspora spinosa TaxID=60894 RepID=A0A2N3XRW7_SACSN|nr:DUF4190 domain-containing protein [Saccharopolyspora spinosa]PKW13405.1 hypothetical protein A8926_0931 [Saccharopolyspora spinosa]
MTTQQPIYQPASPPKRGAGLAITGLVLGLCALLFSLIPLIGVIAWVLAPLGLIFGIIGLRSHKGMAITGIATSAVALIICVAWLGSFASSVSELPKPPTVPAGEAAPTGVPGVADGNALADVKVTSCKVDSNPYFPSVKAQVEIVNSSKDLASYTATIAADAADGSRLGEGPVYSSKLQPGQKTTQESVIMLNGKQSGNVTCSVVSANQLPF